MPSTNLYNRIFEYPPADVAGLVFTEPDEVEKGAESPEIAAWELLLGSMQLRRAGQHSPANDWLNHASHLKLKDDVFKAELLGEAGQGLYETDRLQEAYQILNSAETIWRDVCEEAIAACAGSKQQASQFASHLLPMFVAAKEAPPASEAAPLIKQWLSERAVLGRAQTANCFVRLLAKAGKLDDARKLLDEELQWIALRFTSPATAISAVALGKRAMSATTRRALYLLLLAQGEIELAAGDFQESADSFEAAAGAYEGQVSDHNDINRMLRAKFNQANSLLRLHRIQDAINIYHLCKHGFDSIADAEAAQRVDHAIVFAQSMADDDVS